MDNCLNFLKTWCCFPSARSRPNSPMPRASHYNARLRTNLGWAVPVRNASYDARDPPDQSTAARPRLRSEGRFSNSTVQWSTSSMTREELKELFNLVHATLEHVPYAICGLAALIDHGFAGRAANRISILCPQESKNNVKAWSAARGYEVYADSVGVPTRDGAVRRVRIKYVESGFDRLQRVRSSFSDATVLSLTSQLDNVAAGYLDNRRRGNERALATIASDIFFVLGLMAARSESVDSRLLPTFLGEAFFGDFTARYAAARPEMARAGIDVSAALARHQAAAALQEHDELLRRYGAKGDVVSTQPGQFEGMRTLGDSKSVYTLRDGNASAVPPMPHRPEPSYLRDDDRLGASGPSGLGRSLTMARGPRKPKAADRPAADWV
ncbi:hypothetical protein F4823DRAFT_637868 [Ustulina deusta]|nr:hypothetical protein F4823DRAFT_637868 [Ustulina deusta]